jgi:replication factor C large subunit
MLTEKYRPTNIRGLVGNEQQRLSMVKWLKNWKLGSKPLLLSGPPGIGKSTSVYAIAREFGYTVLEYNASDIRTKNALSESISPSFENSSLFGEEKFLIFLDEIDGLSGRADYAGMDFVLDLIENTTHPLAMAANVEDIQKLKKIIQKSLVLRFEPISEDILLIYLKHVTQQDEVQIPQRVLKQIASNSRGDVRQALNSLQTVTGDKIAGAETDDQFMSDAEAVDHVLSSKTFEEGVQRIRQFDASPYDKISAIFDAVVSAKNLSVEAKAESLESVAKADLIMGKINREQSWRLLRYLDRELVFATFGRGLKRVDSGIPWNLRLAIWNDGRVIKGIEEILSNEYHMGKSTIASFFIPYAALYLAANPELMDKFLEQNELGDSERRVLLKIAQKGV